jgi:hypothetical protein
MEPAAGFLSPRPFPRAAAPPAPPAGPGPPSSSFPRSELEVPAGPQGPDPGRLITDPCSGRSYFKGRLLGKVGRGCLGVVLTRVEGNSAQGGGCSSLGFGDVCGPDSAFPGAPSLMPLPPREASPAATRPLTRRLAVSTRSKLSRRTASPSRINAKRWVQAQ